jgi:hypothetical protein
MAELMAAPRERGERNNNPLNVRWDGRTRWKGMDPDTPSDRFFPVHKTHGFVRFLDPVTGLRAAARALWNYQKLHGLDTIGRIVARWAPPEDDNYTEGYIRLVEGQTGVGRDARVDLRDRDFLARLMAAMIRMECGRNIYPDAMIREAIELAGIPAAPRKGT